MIFTKDGTPLVDALVNALLKATDYAKRPRMLNWLMATDGTGDATGRAYRIGHTKNGDPYRIFRLGVRHRGRYDGDTLRRVRAEHGVGRPPKYIVTCSPTQAQQLAEIAAAPTASSAVKLHGSQRKAAAALGWSLGKLQRQLAKERAVHA